MNAPDLNAPDPNAPDPNAPDVGMPALDLTITRGFDRRSRLCRRHVRFPWSLGRGYPGPADAPVTVIPQLAGAGLLAGDQVRQTIRVGDDAALDLVSAGAMLAYGGPTGRAARSDWSLDLAPGSRTRLVSEPYVLFDNADLVVRQSIRIAEDAVLISLDAFVDASERQSARWHGETIVSRPDGTVLFEDRVRATPASLARQARLSGGRTAFGSVTVLTPDPGPVEAAIDAARKRQDAEVWSGWSILPKQAGLGVRIAAADGQRLRAALRCYLDAATEALP